MAEAARMAGGLDGPVWIMARRQTAARGRRGRVWAQPAGNLAATLVFKPWATPQEAAKRSFLAANVVAMIVWAARMRGSRSAPKMC